MRRQGLAAAAAVAMVAAGCGTAGLSEDEARWCQEHDGSVAQAWMALGLPTFVVGAGRVDEEHVPAYIGVDWLSLRHDEDYVRACRAAREAR